MASNDPRELGSLQLSADERERLEREERRRLEELAAEVARRYDPARLGKLAIAGAGRIEKLDDDTRGRMEARLGGGFRDVRVVRGPFAERVTRRHGADAVTVGSTGIILMRETPRTNLKSPEGRALLAHELTHVRQAQTGMHFALEHGTRGSALEQAAERAERAHLREERLAPSAREGGESIEVWRERVVARVIELEDEAEKPDPRAPVQRRRGR